jgi:pyruvate dehydrogenase E2 component (dihydrolipoamide acetyltransferase)
MATVMTQAHHEVADVTIIDEANVHTWNEQTDCTARVIRAMVKAIQIVPILNTWFDGKQLTTTVHDAVHMGLAIDSPEGLFMPIIRNAQQLNLQQLRGEIDAVKMAVKNRSLTPEQLHGATICLSNFGSIAGRYANPIVIPPTVAILGVGKRYPVVLPTQQGFTAQQMLPLSLTVDHRAVTGGEAARFLHEIIVDLAKAE